ncbi:heterokaryon incompatibility protein-domain-containing protein [Daldinia sp. FL1419]|nr:heterokaryon incompatibility protein-domain-containing protein [Daldinia sp. FL1419]
MLSKTEIRILDLLPTLDSNEDKDLIRCQTRVIPFPTDIQYETVSYVWGAVDDTEYVEVDGIYIPITANLVAALKHIRLSNNIRTLWIDQLCINQHDEKEKANQVALMGQIYSTTSRCLIWLGEISEDVSLSNAQLSLEFIRLISNIELKQEGIWELNIATEFASEQALRGLMQALESIGSRSNAWWARMWTLQEAVLPPKACVLWGGLSMEWEVIVSAAFNWRDMPFDPIVDTYHEALSPIFSQVLGLIFTKEERDPFDTAFRWSFRKASNPLDKVYGLMGLFPAGSLPRVQACDYGLPRATLYAMFTADLIEHNRSLHPIALRCLQNLPESTPDIPRWALDMGVSDRQYAVTVDGNDYAWYLTNTYDCYEACGMTTINWNRFRYNQIFNALELTGCMIDTVAVAGSRPQYDKTNTCDVTCAGAAQMIQDWYQMADKFYQSQAHRNPILGTSPWPDSFWRGLLGNITLNPEYFFKGLATSEDVELAKKFAQTGHRNDICDSIFANLVHRKMIITRTGLLGFVPHHANVGDQIWILHGGKTPFVLRPTEGTSQLGDEYVFIGSCYIHGIMEGEAMEPEKISTDVVLK